MENELSKSLQARPRGLSPNKGCRCEKTPADHKGPLVTVRCLPAGMVRSDGSETLSARKCKNGFTQLQLKGANTKPLIINGRFLKVCA
jgi:hypothetical protein